MRERAIAGRIINISTGAARPANVSDNGIATYAVSKFGLEALSAFLAAESPAITVTTLRPDTIDTDMVASLFPLDQRLRMLGPESVVPAALYLASAPRAEVHGRIFEQLQLVEQLAGDRHVQQRASRPS
jgi:NAD(P)-dependent dehydrogenase (short-subunit alcohol dehydrogenase family)